MNLDRRGFISFISAGLSTFGFNKSVKKEECILAKTSDNSSIKPCVKNNIDNGTGKFYTVITGSYSNFSLNHG